MLRYEPRLENDGVLEYHSLFRKKHIKTFTGPVKMLKKEYMQDKIQQLDTKP